MIKDDKKRYNLIVITIDGARVDRINKFENFNKLKNKGTFFSNSITYGPQTVTALYSIFTGIYGNKTKANNYFGSMKFKKDYFKTLTQYLKDAGYYTEGDILNEIILPSQGFDNLKIHDEIKDDIIERHTKLIKETSRLRKENKNFFLYLHYSKIHTEIIKNVVKKYNDFDDVYFNNIEENIKNYDKYIEKADEYLREIFKVFEELDLFKDTIFVIFSDHGVSVGEKKGEMGYGRYCYDYTLRTFVSFIQSDIFPKKEVNKLSRGIDIMPTILDILKIPEDKNFGKIQGKSLIPLIDEEPDERISFSESAGIEKEPTNTEPSIKCIRTKDWKLIYNTKNKKKELYNLKEDPQENKDISEENLEKTKEFFDKLIKISPEIREIKKAVILAGGLSKRMGEIGKHTIKCLLPIDKEESIIEREVRLLKKNGINDIVLVIGHKGEQLKNKFNDSVRYIEDPLYKKEGMLDSLCFAMKEFNEPFLFMYSDSIFSESALKKIINSNKKGIVCLVSNKDVNDESEKIKIENSRIIKCNKEIPNKDAEGEFTGIIKNDEEGAKKFKESLQMLWDSNMIEQRNVRDLIEFMAEKNIDIMPEFISAEDWMEIDFLEEYNFAKNDFIFQIQIKDKKNERR